MNKKGAELSMNVIIIAAIGLLVLVVLAILVFNSANKTDIGTNCISKGGVCKETCGVGVTAISSGKCSDTAMQCCPVVSMS